MRRLFAPLRPALAVAITALAAIAGAAQPLQPHEDIRTRVHHHLEQRLAPEQRADAQIEVGHLDPRLRLAACDRPLETFPTGRGESIGAVTVGVRCASPRPWTLYVSARVVVFGPVVVATRSLPRGTEITAADVRLVRKDRSRLAYGWLAATEEAIGKVTKRPFAAEQALQPGQLEEPKLVRRGEQVVVRVVRDGFEVSMAGRALGDGARGQHIRVRNLNSARIIEAEVIAPGVVRVRI